MHSGNENLLISLDIKQIAKMYKSHAFLISFVSFGKIVTFPKKYIIDVKVQWLYTCFLNQVNQYTP